MCGCWGISVLQARSITSHSGYSSAGENILPTDCDFERVNSCPRFNIRVLRTLMAARCEMGGRSRNLGKFSYKSFFLWWKKSETKFI